MALPLDDLLRRKQRREAQPERSLQGRNWKFILNPPFLLRALSRFHRLPSLLRTLKQIRARAGVGLNRPGGAGPVAEAVWRVIGKAGGVEQVVEPGALQPPKPPSVSPHFLSSQSSQHPCTITPMALSRSTPVLRSSMASRQLRGGAAGVPWHS